MKWTKEDEQKIIDLLKSGETYESISILLNRTKRSIKEKANKLGHNFSMYNKTEYIEKICPVCNKTFNVSKNDKQQIKYIYCSKSCSATENNRKRKLNIAKKYFCKNCDKELHREGKYCNHDCQWEHTYKEYIKRWKNGKEDGMCGEYNTSRHIRKYLFEKYNNKCSRCGWDEKNPFTGKTPLEVEHIDGNHKNNKEENLDLICPNCHSLTETYKGANKGKGRKERKRHYENRNKHYEKIERKQNYCSCGKEIHYQSNMCEECSHLSQRKVKNRPDKDTLLNDVELYGYKRTGNKYGVSDNTIRKWIKK